MASCKVFVMILIVCFTGFIYAAPIEEEDFPVFFDEDHDAENDEFQDQMMSFPHTLVIPGHMIRKLQIKLHKQSESTDNMESTDNDTLTSATDSAAGQKLRVIRVPHNMFTRLSKYAKSATDMPSENTDNSFPDLDNTEEGNYLVDGTDAGLKVLRVPHNIFRKPGKMIRRRKLHKLSQATDNMESTADLASALHRTTGQKFRVIRVPHNIFSRLAKYDKSTDTDNTYMSNENTDSNFTDMDNDFPDVDNTEEGNFQVEGVAGTSAGLKVLRVPHNGFRKLAKLIPQRMRTAVTDLSLESLVDGKENTKIRVLNVPHSVYRKLKEMHHSALDEAPHSVYRKLKEMHHSALDEASDESSD